MRTSAPHPNYRSSPGSSGNTVGLITPKPSPNGALVNGKPTANTDPPLKAETAAEETFLAKLSNLVHTGLDIAGFAPALGAIPDLINAGLYLLEGDKANALLSTIAAVPGPGDGVKAGVMAGKTARLGVKKATAKAADSETAEHIAVAAGRESNVPVRDSPAPSNGGSATGGGVSHAGTKGPCDHLKKGSVSGRGLYRGGSYGGTRKQGLQSHHAPPASVSPLGKREGPALQMDVFDHFETLSHGGQGLDGKRYRQAIAGLLEKGEWRTAMAAEVRDVRRVAGDGGKRRKYNVALQEMLQYFHCLERQDRLTRPR